MKSGFWQDTELNLHRCASLPLLRCWQKGSLGAAFVTLHQRVIRIFGKRGFTVLQSSLGAHALPSSHAFRV